MDAATRFGGMAGALYGNSRNGLGGEMGAGSDESAPQVAVGQIHYVIGAATALRLDGAFIRLKPGDHIFEGDVIETTADAEVRFCFVDGTTFRLSSNARAIIKEFSGKGGECLALVDIDRGDFAFFAGEIAKAGRLGIDTPVANIRGRMRTGGIGTLSLVSLFFALMDKVQAADPDFAYIDDGTIIPNYKDDTPHGSFELVTKEATPRHIFVDDPGVTWAFRLGTSSELSISQISNSPARM
ncbi:MAG TPA: hypothetical protein VHS31_13485, partial [Tepidisphaeraceae bacterium]|nr:hypothetical protein [Tepidisphaeraceae bacterium]